MEILPEDFGTPDTIPHAYRARRSAPVDIPLEKSVGGARPVQYITGSGRFHEAVFTYTPSSDSEHGSSFVVPYDPDTDRLLDGDPMPDSDGYDASPGCSVASIDVAAPSIAETVRGLRRSIDDLQTCVRILTRRVERMERNKFSPLV
jgi:hypothetical protein